MSSSQTLLSSTEPVAKAYVGLLDVPCRVEVIVGTGSLTVRECLKLKRDSVIRLREVAGSDLRVTVQGVPAATGEIVVDDETTSVKISAVLSPPSAEAQL
jgi:flagellar motor switch/type III secretory pathway protein FliN